MVISRKKKESTEKEDSGLRERGVVQAAGGEVHFRLGKPGQKGKTF